MFGKLTVIANIYRDIKMGRLENDLAIYF